MTKPNKIPGSDEAWDSGQLGREEEFAKAAEPDEKFEQEIDDSLELQLISIRLQRSLIEDFKGIASLNGIGYQPLMRQILTRFVEAEKKKLLREMASERAKAAAEEKRIAEEAALQKRKVG